MSRLLVTIAAAMALAALVVAGLPSCGLAAGGTAGKADGDDNEGPVYIGAIYNLTGAQAPLDRPSARGAVLAVDQANRAGGVLGRRIRLVVRDGESGLETVAEAARELLRDYPKMAALMGLSDTDMVIAAAPVAARAGRAFLTSGATSPDLPGQVPDYLMLACFGDDAQAAAAAEWLWRDRGVRRVSVMFDSTMSYTQVLHRYFIKRFRELGGRIAAVEPYGAGGLPDAVATLPAADAYYVAAGPDDAGEAATLLRVDGKTGPIVGGDAFDAEGLWRRLPQLEGIFFTTHAYIAADNPDPRVAAFRKAYRKAYPDDPPDAFAALGYDAARLLISAVRAAGTDDPERVRAALGATVRFDGVTGTLGYRPGNYVPRKEVTIVGVSDGKRRFIKRFAPETGPQP